MGVWGSLAIATLWVTTRTLTPPLPGGQVEPVTLPGVAATALELAALLALATLLPTSPRRRRHPAPGRPRFATGWALLAGAGFAVIFALASGTLVYTPAPLSPSIRVPSLTLADVPLPLGSPLLTWFLTRHLYLLGPLTAFAFLTIAAALLAVSTGLGIGLARAAPHCAPRRGGLAALAPTLPAVPVCCGAPLAGSWAPARSCHCCAPPHGYWQPPPCYWPPTSPSCRADGAEGARPPPPAATRRRRSDRSTLHHRPVSSGPRRQVRRRGPHSRPPTPHLLK